ncbi:hypothetical protein EUTSA_v10028330mg [Eutrema salsugineum]|uniref:TF-B3 domain-containing protein n=1 Tax=Eutrema salsugineum TaxID=72664 RepID=V4M528_EUTSA|nr:hypothetical protein EUTSA_v10028330mg [Eutrema salsugineum]
MVNKHFFKPILPGFHSHLVLSVFLYDSCIAFFSKYIQGTNEQKMTTAKLRSDVSKIAWKVKIEEDGQKLTDGWKQFALAHDLRIGDILIFRHEKHMAFHVKILGPSGCEVQYESCLDDKSNLEKTQRKKKVEKNPKTEAGSSSSSLDPSCYVANISPATLRYDSLRLPVKISRENGLDTRCGEIVLMNEKGTSWKLNLKQKRSCESGTMYIRRGWRSFCSANGLRAGDSITFKLIQRGGNLVLRLSSTESEEACPEGDEIESLSTKSEKSIWKASSSESQNRLLTLTLKPYNLTKSNLETKMHLLDKNGVKWYTNLRSAEKGKQIRLVGGWKDFFKANCVKIDEPILLKLIWEGDTSCILQFCSKVK